MKDTAYCFDLDGTICNTIDKQYANATPYLEVVKKINELYDFHISLIKTTGFRRLSMSRTGRHANPSANDTGIRTTISTAKTPNISSETSPGLMRMTPWQVGGAGEHQPRYFPRGKAPT